VDPIEEFVARYRKEYDFYSRAARLVAETLDRDLQGAGIRCIVTDRAKSVSRLEAKCRQRAASSAYSSVDEIYDDIVDLAGVRVALYFPAEREQVEGLIRRTFVLIEEPKRFPEGSLPVSPRRFAGYNAVHFRVRLREADLGEADKRYAEARVEIQVASVLMHAWAEVEHDLVYKPLAGELSSGEHMLLDQLNGLVMAGEIALEALQKAGEVRVAETGRRFANHYDLAGHLLSAATVLEGPVNESGLGRVDDLFELLTRLDLDTPERLEPYVKALHGDLEARPIAEQIIDQVLAEDQERYDLYEAVRSHRRWAAAEPSDTDGNVEIGNFLAQWIRVERVLRDAFSELDDPRRVTPILRLADNPEVLDPDLRPEFHQLRRLRNNLVHGVEVPAAAELAEAAGRLSALADHIERRLHH
jgi:ppGpp synthetase/RelA/SpoT-type nucleotidyltranferase